MGSDMAVGKALSITVFDPNTVGLLSLAFESALRSLDASDDDHLDPYSTRHVLAKYIIEAATDGERDIVRLRDSALSRLREHPN